MIAPVGWPPRTCSIAAGLLLLVLWTGACAASTRAPNAPIVVAGSVCSGVTALDPKRLFARTETAAPEKGKRALLAFMSEGDSPALMLLDLTAQRVRWQVPLKAASRPQILEDVVVTTTAERTMVGYDLETGVRRFAVPLERAQWLGAAQSGKRIVFTSSASPFDPKERGSTLAAIDASDGSRLWQRDVPYALARPVVRADLALVLSDRADLWALELASGDDAGCERIGGNVIEWLAASEDRPDVMFGANEARSLGPDGHEATPALVLPRRELPGRPLLSVSSYQPRPAERSAHGRVALIAPLKAAGPGSRAGLSLATDQAAFYFVFYRDVFGFRADGSLAWARLLESDVVQAEATESGLVLATEAGLVQALDRATGADRGAQRLPLRIASADLTLAGWPGPSVQGQALELQASLTLIARDSDARLLPARLLAVDELALLDAPSVTRDLLAIYAGANTPTGLRDRIAKVLRERKPGREHLLEALEQHEDFLDERPAPPLRAIVPGLVHAGEARAVPGLIAQLFDPDTQAADLALLVSAIDALGGDEVREPLARFFAMYRADSALEADPRALGLAAQALHARKQPATLALLEQAQVSEATLPALREELAEMLAAKTPDPIAAPVEAAAAEAADGVPAALSLAALRASIDSPAGPFQPCISEARQREPKLGNLRLWFVVQTGKARDLRVMPNDSQLAKCLEGQLAPLRIDIGQNERQLVSYRFTPRVAAASEPQGAARKEEESFWARAERAATKNARVSQAPPWWQDKNPLFVAIDAPAQAPQKPAQDLPPTAAGTEAPATPPEEPWWLPAQGAVKK